MSSWTWEGMGYLLHNGSLLSLTCADICLLFFVPSYAGISCCCTWSCHQLWLLHLCPICLPHFYPEGLLTIPDPAVTFDCHIHDLCLILIFTPGACWSIFRTWFSLGCSQLRLLSNLVAFLCTAGIFCALWGCLQVQHLGHLIQPQLQHGCDVMIEFCFPISIAFFSECIRGGEPCCSLAYLWFCLRRSLSPGSFLRNPHQPQAHSLAFSPGFNENWMKDPDDPDESWIVPDYFSSIKLWINLAPTSLRSCLLLIFEVQFVLFCFVLFLTSFHQLLRHLSLQ